MIKRCEIRGSCRSIISKDFYDRCLTGGYREFKIERINLLDLRAGIWEETDKGFRIIIRRIDATPVYKFLQGDREQYEEYVRLLKRQRKDADYSVEKLESLIESMETHGYQKELIVVWWGENSIKDGQHRAAILYHQHGNIEVEVVSIKR